MILREDEIAGPAALAGAEVKHVGVVVAKLGWSDAGGSGVVARCRTTPS